MLTGASVLIDFWQVFLIMSLIALLSGLVAGTYPAFAFIGFKPTEVLKNTKTFSFAHKASTFSLKRVMVTLQFAISMLLIASAFIARNQLQYLNEKNLGMDKEQILAIYGAGDAYKNNYQLFKERLKRIDGVKMVSTCMEVPSREIRDAGPVLIKGINMDKELAPIMDIQLIDNDFVKTMGLSFLAGGNLPKSLTWDPIPEFTEDFTIQDYLISKRRAYLINETAMRKLGWNKAEDALGNEINWSIGSYELAMGPITGVVRDFHQETLKNVVDPTVLVFEPLWLSTFLVKLETSEIQETIGNINNAWDTMFPQYPMEYYFLDDLYNNLYKNERIKLNLLYILSGLAIFIAFIGLFGLIAYALQTRVKEVAIRKILGADISALIGLISKEYLIVMIFGAVLAIPMSYIWANEWLQNFAYRTEISATNYLITIVLISLILMATISIQVVRSALVNPADTLRNE
jgi:putative ABC transport system permease protein